MTDCLISPVRMGGLVKETAKDRVKIHLFGRLGVITVPLSLINTGIPPVPGHTLSFYFSYIEVTDTPYDYDLTGLIAPGEPEPCLLGGTLTEVNDTAVTVELPQHLGSIRVPRRWIFTDYKLREGLAVQLWFSRISVTGKREIPAEFI